MSLIASALSDVSPGMLERASGLVGETRKEGPARPRFGPPH